MLGQELLSLKEFFILFIYLFIYLFFCLIRHFYSPNIENLPKYAILPNLYISLTGHYLAC